MVTSVYSEKYMPRPFMIIAKDNLARESVAEKLVHGAIPDTPENRVKAQEYCDWINTFSCDNYGGTFYCIVESDHKLWRGMAELI